MSFCRSSVCFRDSIRFLLSRTSSFRFIYVPLNSFMFFTFPHITLEIFRFLHNPSSSSSFAFRFLQTAFRNFQVPSPWGFFRLLEASWGPFLVPFHKVLMSFQKQVVQSIPRIRGISQREKHERWWCKWCTSWISYKTKTRTLFSSQLITRFEHGKSLILFILQVKWWTQVDNDTKMSLISEQVLKCLSNNWVAWLRNAMIDLYNFLISSLVRICLSWNTNKLNLEIE